MISGGEEMTMFVDITSSLLYDDFKIGKSIDWYLRVAEIFFFLSILLDNIFK